MKQIYTGLVILFFSICIVVTHGCATFSYLSANGKEKPRKQLKIKNTDDDDNQLENSESKDFQELMSLIENHRVKDLTPSCSNKFIDLYIRTRNIEYLPKGNRTFCKKFFYDYFNEIGYEKLLEEIRQVKGKTMVEKAITYKQEHGRIEILLSGYEAQMKANSGRDVGVIGEYYYDKEEKIFTEHYSVVQPSNIAFNDEGKMVPYYVTGLITKRKDANNRYGTGTFLAQAGVANGLIDFCWAYNRKEEGIIQKDENGKLRGGIIFLVFPVKNTPVE